MGFEVEGELAEAVESLQEKVSDLEDAINNSDIEYELEDLRKRNNEQDRELKELWGILEKMRESYWSRTKRGYSNGVTKIKKISRKALTFLRIGV